MNGFFHSLKKKKTLFCHFKLTTSSYQSNIACFDKDHQTMFVVV